MDNGAETKIEGKGFFSNPNNKKFITKLCCAFLALSVLGMGFLFLKDTVFKKDVTWTLSDDGVLTISGKGKIEGIDHLKPGEWLENSGYKKINKIVIKDGITEIGDYAFYKCSYATELVLPKTLKAVGDFAFFGCSKIPRFNFKSGLVSIGEGALYGCSGAKEITLPATVTEVGYDAFYGTGYYKAPENWRGNGLYLGGCLLDVKPAASDTFTVEKGTAVIANRAFLGCTAIKDVVMADTVTHVGPYAFSGCISLKSVSFGKSLSAIPAGLFWNCTTLKTVKTPDNWETLVKKAGDDWKHGVGEVVYK